MNIKVFSGRRMLSWIPDSPLSKPCCIYISSNCSIGLLTLLPSNIGKGICPFLSVSDSVMCVVNSVVVFTLLSRLHFSATCAHSYQNKERAL